MKKLLFFKTFFKTVIIFFVYNIFIVEVKAQSIGLKIPNPSRYNNLEEVISAAGSLIRPLFLLTFGAMLLFGAFLLLSSQGNNEKIINSRNTIVAAVIGFVIAALAPTIINIVTSFLGIEGF